MMYFYFALILFVLQEVHSQRSVRLDNINGGEFSSPGYPRNYPPSIGQKYYIRAPKGYRIIVTFTDFEIEDNAKSNYVKVIDGKRNSGVELAHLFGHQQTPITFTSSRNRLWLIFVANNKLRHKGFRGTYSFVDGRSYCSLAALDTPEVTITSCTDEVHGFAKQCSVVKDNYKVEMNCTDGIFTAVDTTLVEEIVIQCESNQEECPYTDEEIFTFYDNHQLSPDDNLTEQELAAKLEFEEQGIRIGRFGGCPLKLCCRKSDTTYVYPRACGQFGKRIWKRICLHCRRISCGVGVGVFAVSGRSGTVCS